MLKLVSAGLEIMALMYLISTFIRHFVYLMGVVVQEWGQLECKS